MQVLHPWRSSICAACLAIVQVLHPCRSCMNESDTNIQASSFKSVQIDRRYCIQAYLASIAWGSCICAAGPCRFCSNIIHNVAILLYNPKNNTKYFFMISHLINKVFVFDVYFLGILSPHFPVFVYTNMLVIWALGWVAYHIPTCFKRCCTLYTYTFLEKRKKIFFCFANIFLAAIF